MKKASKIILTVIFMSVILFFISCPIVNNIFAKHIIEDINTIPLPQNTYMVEQFSQAGKLVGNGNGMQLLYCLNSKPAASNVFAFPDGNLIFAVKPTERITHYTLQAKSCAQ